MELQIKGARTQHLWGGDKTALFSTEALTRPQAESLLAKSAPNTIELLYAGGEGGWNSLLRSELV